MADPALAAHERVEGSGGHSHEWFSKPSLFSETSSSRRRFLGAGTGASFLRKEQLT